MSAPEIVAVCHAATARLAAGAPAAAAALIAPALRRFPADPNLLYVSGNCALAAGDEEAAVSAYRRSVAAAPTFVAALANLGFVLRCRQAIAEARDVLRRAVSLEPTHAVAWINLASCYVNEGEPAAGEAVAREALMHHPGNAVLRWNLALLLLEQGQWREGWREYRQRFDTPVVARPAGVAGLRRLAALEDVVAGHTVLCHGEQGLGDELLFAGVLAEFVTAVGQRGGRVTLAPNPRLAGVFRRSFSLPHWNPGSGPNAAAEAAAPDWVVGIGDLPGFFRNDDRSFPQCRGYLTVDAAAVAVIRSRLAAAAPGRPLVGIAWRGGSAYTHAVHRTIPLADWLPLLHRDAVFVSLAYHDAAAELATVRDAHGISILDLAEITRAADYERTCELVAALDLVITVPTSVLHVAGGVGTDCWVVMDERAAWRETSRDAGLPWYPLTHTRFVRPRTDPDWRATIARVAAEFATRLVKQVAEHQNLAGAPPTW